MSPPESKRVPPRRTTVEERSNPSAVAGCTEGDTRGDGTDDDRPAGQNSTDGGFLVAFVTVDEKGTGAATVTAVVDAGRESKP